MNAVRSWVRSVRSIFQKPDSLSILFLYLHPAAVSGVFSIRGSEPLCSFYFWLTFLQSTTHLFAVLPGLAISKHGLQCFG